jgi:hypothetical protein
MTGRPYRVLNGRFESAAIGPLALSDDASLFALLLQHPDWLSSDVVFVADGRVLSESDPARRSVLGWHRYGGPVLLGATTGVADPALLVETVQLAGVSAEWSPEQWDEALAAFWAGADQELKQRVARCWQLSSEPWRLESWTRAAWGEAPAKGRALVGVIAGSVPLRVRRTIDWLAAEGREIAGYEVRRMQSGEAITYWTTPVAGAWPHAADAGPVPEEAGRRRDTYVHHTGGVTAGLLSAVEMRCRELESQVAWSGEDWVRFDGHEHSLRVFPGAAWVDLQLVGADEGTLKGLSYRFGVSESLTPGEDAPPEVHFRLASASDLSPSIHLLLGAWLGEGPPDERTPDPPLDLDLLTKKPEPVSSPPDH